MWALSVTLDRTTRRLGDRLNIMFQGYVARLQAEVATVEHHERPVYLDRIAVLRTGVFALDHLFRSMFTMVGWLLRLAFVVHPARRPSTRRCSSSRWARCRCSLVAVWRPKVEKRTEEAVASHGRLARHLFSVATTPPPGKEVRVTGNQAELVRRRTAAWGQWFGPIRATNLASAAWLTLAWALFSLAFVAAVVWVVTGLDRGPGAVVLVLTAGGRLSAYVGSAVGELGFLRGIWLDSAQRLAWLEDFAAAQNARVDESVPERLDEGIRFENVSFAYPGTEPGGAPGRRPAPSPPAASSPSSARTARASRRWSSCWRGCTRRLGPHHRRRRRHRPRRHRAVARAAGRGVPGLRAARVRRRDDRRPRRRTTPGRPRRGRRRRRPGRCHAGGRRPARTVSTPSSARRGTTASTSSFGQWQKLALARGYMRAEPLLLMLDEPTAALDAETEHALFERFAAGRPRGRPRTAG